MKKFCKVAGIVLSMSVLFNNAEGGIGSSCVSPDQGASKTKKTRMRNVEAPRTNTNSTNVQIEQNSTLTSSENRILEEQNLIKVEEKIFDASCISDFNAKEITIPGTFTTIAPNTFDNCPNLRKVTIDDGVFIIDTCAFANCYNLEEIVFPSSITSICSGAFSDCISLKTVNLPSNILHIGNNAFSECHNLSLYGFSIPKNTVSIGDNAFRNCGINILGQTTDTKKEETNTFETPTPRQDEKNGAIFIGQTPKQKGCISKGEVEMNLTVPATTTLGTNVFNSYINVIRVD